MSIEAMKQALEALKNASPHLNEALQNVGGMAEYEVELECDRAITALRTAIAEAEKQEPVAHVVVVGDMVSVTTGSAGLKDLLTLGDGAPLYTTPPAAPVQDECVVCGDKVRVIPRPWVGLTEEEHTQIAVDAGCMSSDWVFYGAAVERSLKKKNT